jgi:hypothetical protein
MNRRYSALAMSALAMGAVALTATEASAMLKDPGGEPGAATTRAYDWPDEGSGYPGSQATSPPCNYANHPLCKVAENETTEPGSAEYNYPNYDPQYEVAPVDAAMASSPSDDNGAEALQAGASALGGVGLAFGGMWLYRRRHVLAD